MEADITPKSRPSWDEYFIQVTNTMAERATCGRGRIGCVIVKNNQIVASGYVGSPRGEVHCDEAGHLFHTVIHADGKKRQHCIRTVHAEQNAICQAAKRGAAIEGSTLYCGMTPCRTCAMMIVSCGIVRVVCQRKYHAGKDAEEIFLRAKVALEFIHNEIQTYETS